MGMHVSGLDRLTSAGPQLFPGQSVPLAVGCTLNGAVRSCRLVVLFRSAPYFGISILCFCSLPFQASDRQQFPVRSVPLTVVNVPVARCAAAKLVSNSASQRISATHVIDLTSLP